MGKIRKSLITQGLNAADLAIDIPLDRGDGIFGIRGQVTDGIIAVIVIGLPWRRSL